MLITHQSEYFEYVGEHPKAGVYCTHHRHHTGNNKNTKQLSWLIHRGIPYHYLPALMHALIKALSNKKIIREIDTELGKACEIQY